MLLSGQAKQSRLHCLTALALPLRATPVPVFAGGFALLLLRKGRLPASGEELEIAQIAARRKAEEAERLRIIMSGSRKESRLKIAEEKDVYHLDR